MTAPFDQERSRETWWEDEGSRIAGELSDVSAVLVMGLNADASARVALGIARAESTKRHVALGDLIGDLAPLYAVAGGDDAFGLTDCLRQQLPLNDIARKAPDSDSLFILPAGSPPVSSHDIIAHERWPKLVNGFAKAGALLVLVTEPDAPGIATLEAATSGVVLVGGPVPGAKGFRVLATANAPSAVRAEPAPRPSGVKFRRAVFVCAALGLLASAGWYAWQRNGAATVVEPATSASPVPKASAPEAAQATQAPVATAAIPLTDTVRLSDPVNPADSSSTAAFAVEVMAANTLAGANSFLANNAKSGALSGATVSPVAVGGSANVWYKVVAGVSHARAGADSLLARMRRDGIVRQGDGRVVKVPYAVLMDYHLDVAKAKDVEMSPKFRAFSPYHLLQQDGTVSTFAGAFETPAQAAPLISALRAAGFSGVVAFRTGRTF